MFTVSREEEPQNKQKATMNIFIQKMVLKMKWNKLRLHIWNYKTFVHTLLCLSDLDK